jgi:diguanylate cyclase (GGDEF)-like protein/PAS domain S-box-containing protein
MPQNKPSTKDKLIAELAELKLKAQRLEEAELALRESEERYRRLLESVTDYVYTVTVRDGRAVATTHGEGCRHVTGYTAGEYNADPNLWYRMIHVEDRDMVLNQVGMLQKGLDAPSLEHRIIHKDGSVRWVRSTPVIRRDAFGRVAFYDGVIQDITDSKSMEEQIRHAALHDPLTLLPNRLMLSDRLARMIEDARQEGGKVAVLFVDLDHFKPINDALGHAVGDEVLKEVASRLVRHVRVSDTVARVGGDEFVVALGRQRDESGPIDVAKKIIKALARPYRTLKGTKGPGCSIGITLFPDDGQDPGMLIKLADAAMYYVKNHQRGSYAFHSRQEAPQSRPKPA